MVGNVTQHPHPRGGKSYVKVPTLVGACLKSRLKSIVETLIHSGFFGSDRDSIMHAEAASFSQPHDANNSAASSAGVSLFWGGAAAAAAAMAAAAAAAAMPSTAVKQWKQLQMQPQQLMPNLDSDPNVRAVQACRVRRGCA